ncbi:5-methylcytosine-specific restriction related enzyme [Corallococcus coralloides DSM 2259]|uniref:5-methylcytosine-specific restriction related enzyme n=1 Tax=Corallococcus coralloides (strain ATCC 25202 / DSM 2259 / NBRC 100086 / M2) TaxID=1144275 RepID=H8MNF5_CORCM|nr:5-methylcytosine-specific restriction related enzyme [Corallococcus coralloides]AFE05372.1 5-methylcytosine-specific restriction related enzyme [Corallococcus coralloides DSM 2259]
MKKQPRVFWVNQGHSYEHERDAGYISAHKRDVRGYELAHRTRVGTVAPGDIIVSYKVRVLALGRVTSQPFTVTDKSGEILRASVEYFELPEPIAIDALSEKLRQLQPAAGPLDHRGTPKMGYLWEFSAQGLATLRSANKGTWPAWAEAVCRESAPRLFKIAPGENARFWEECFAGGYICVGWDEVGDLRQYESFEDFRTAFAEKTEERGKAANHISRKANELWAMRTLKLGDLIAANKGTSEILAVGEVVEPGYEWNQERAAYRHTVRVKWDKTKARTIPKQGWWAWTTVTEATPTIRALVLGEAPSPTPVLHPLERIEKALSDRGLFFTRELVSHYLLALQTKRFVILTGISGTGKTQLALAMADAFRPTIQVARPAQTPASAVCIRVKPYMLKYRRTIIPTQLVAQLEFRSAPAEKLQIEVHYPRGVTSLSVWEDPKRKNLFQLLFRGEFATWFESSLKADDEFMLSVTSDDDGFPTRLRVSLVRPEIHARPLNNLEVIAVRPDWNDNRGLLGYFNPLTQHYVRTPFLNLLLAASAEHEQATAEGRSPHPFFAVLDEMNLARVEHYFSDFLSCIEAGEPLHLHDHPELAEGQEEPDEEDVERPLLPVPQRLRIPPNFFFTGTVNIDETTYMFSPKVLDRAFVLEFNDVNLEHYGQSSELELAASPMSLSGLMEELEMESSPGPEDWSWLAEPESGRLRRFLVDLHRLLANEHRPFGYRVANEIARYLRLVSMQTEGSSEALWTALDLALLGKVLPKLAGTQADLEHTLLTLFDFLTRDLEGKGEPANPTAWRLEAGTLIPPVAHPVVPRMPRSGAKVLRMLHRLQHHGFTSFIQ